MIRHAARLDRSCEPLLCYHADHYFRCYLRIVKGATRADAALKCMGYASFDKKTLQRSLAPTSCDPADAGPLWGGDLSSRGILEDLEVAKDLGTHSRCEKFLGTLMEECSAPPLFYKLDEFAKLTKHSPPKLPELVRALLSSGHAASRTHFDPKGFKTDADVRDIIDCFTAL
jgi:tRNA (guanine26-N2/guanine27-N2)-dimethyltransferase